ncbi:MAG: glycosyltransferase [Hyphomicrobium sp.]|uniref:glycosyltransferase n=1 Tax=Hyphomicrobium sp. TaxID=82 RepID=UPI0039E47CC5
MSSKVSVAIKSYNHAPYVRQCLESVLAQTYDNLEIIVTDDASTDGTAEIIRGISDHRIDFKALEVNTGISNAMNATLARATGDYVAILNSDDLAFPDRVEKQIRFLDAHPEIDALFGIPKMIAENGEPTNEPWQFSRPGEFTNAAWLRFFFQHGNCLCAPTAMIRRSAYVRAGLYDPRLTNLQDFDMWVRMLVGGSNLWLSSDEVTAFRVRDGARNASAFRRDSQLRVRYEYSRILRWYRTLSDETLKRVFSDDLKSGAVRTENKPKDVWLSEIALTVDLPPHRLFALDTLFDTAESLDDYKRLSDVMGRTDVFGFWTEKELHDVIAQKNEKIARLRSPISKALRSFRKKIRG